MNVTEKEFIEHTSSVDPEITVTVPEPVPSAEPIRGEFPIAIVIFTFAALFFAWLIFKA